MVLIPVTLSAANLAERNEYYVGNITVEVRGLPTHSRVRTSIPIEVFIVATPVASRCTLDTPLVNGAPTPLLVAVNARQSFTFTARDINGLPLARAIDGSFSAQFYACNVNATVENRCPLAIAGLDEIAQYIHGGTYRVEISLPTLGEYLVLVALDGVFLPFAQPVTGICEHGKYDKDGKCVYCPDDKVHCTQNVDELRGSRETTVRSITLASLDLRENYWRLSKLTSDIWPCNFDHEWKSQGGTSCLGGVDVASASCVNGTQGPRCQICVQGSSRYYFDPAASRCRQCPTQGLSAFLMPLAILAPVAVLLGLLLLGAMSLVQRRLSPETEGDGLHARGSINLAAQWRQLSSAASRIGLLAKLKLCLGFYQVMVTLPWIYDIPLPPEYWKTVGKFLKIFEFQWLTLHVPLSCIGDLPARLAIQALTPLALLAIAVACSSAAVGVAVRCSRETADRERPNLWQCMSMGVLCVMPLTLVTLYTLVLSVSSLTFSAFACTPFGYDDASGTFHYFVTHDMSIQCDDSNQYQDLKRLAYGLCILWPIGAPALFSVLLFVSRKDIRDRRPGELSNSVRFLFIEYTRWRPLAGQNATSLTLPPPPLPPLSQSALVVLACCVQASLLLGAGGPRKEAHSHGLLALHTVTIHSAAPNPCHSH